MPPQDALHLLLPAARQDRHERGVRRRPERCHERLVRLLRPQVVDHRMADVRGRHAAGLEERLLVRQDAGHVREAAAEFPHPPRRPRPDLRRDVPEDGNPPGPQTAAQQEVEAGAVEHDGQVRPLGGQHPVRPAQAVQVVRHAAQQRGHADDAQVGGVGEQPGAGGLHARPAEGQDLGVRFPPPDGPDEAGGMEVSGGFAGADEESRASSHGHLRTEWRHCGAFRAGCGSSRSSPSALGGATADGDNPPLPRRARTAPVRAPWRRGRAARRSSGR